MTKRPKQRSALVDGEKIRALSLERGMNQKALARKSGVNVRTLQRAENGKRVRLDVIGNIANALKVQPSEIILNPRGADEGNGDEQPRSGYQLIRLKRVNSAREFTEMIVEADEIVFESDVEVNVTSADDISRMMQMIEAVSRGEAGLARTVQNSRGSSWLSVDPESIMFLGRLQSSIDSLGSSFSSSEIGIFVGKYRETVGRGERDDDSSEAIQSPKKYTFETTERLVVRFSEQRAGSFAYEAEMGLTDDEADATILAMREDGCEVRDRRAFTKKSHGFPTDEKFEHFVEELERPKILGKAAQERLLPFGLQPLKDAGDDSEQGESEPDENVGENNDCV